MKRKVSLILILAMCFCLCACGGGPEEVGEIVYESTKDASGIVDQLASDIYSAWNVGIYDDDEVVDGGCEYLAGEVSLSVDDLTMGAAYYLALTLEDDEWDDLSEEDQEYYIDNADYLFYLADEVGYSMFSITVSVVIDAYEMNGSLDDVKDNLKDAKEQLKVLSEDHSDYEHYNSLKEYYNAVNSFFNFLSDPTGSFEQLKDTINDYRKDIRDCEADLEYAFD